MGARCCGDASAGSKRTPWKTRKSGGVIGWVCGFRSPKLRTTSQPEFFMSGSEKTHLPATFNRLAWSNLAAQSAEQIALAAAPIVAVLLLGVGEGPTGLLQTPP